MLPVKQSILLVELSYVVLSDDRLTNAIKTLLQSRILFLKILNSRLVYTGHSLFNLQRVDFITFLSLSKQGKPGSLHASPSSVLCSRGNPNICSPTEHQLTYGPPSAASLNCLVSPSLQELKPYPQSSLYNLCLVVPSLPSLLWARQTALYTALALLVDPSVPLFLEFLLDLVPSTSTHVKSFSLSSSN